MGLPEDLKHLGAGSDGFQLIPEDVAGAIVGLIVAALVIGDVLWHLTR